MNNLVSKIIEQHIQDAIDKLGEKQTLIVIERIAQPIIRLKLRSAYYKLVV